MRRTEHCGFSAELRRREPLDLLRASVRGRIPALVGLKNERMAASPFGFFRGAVPVMAYDLSLGKNSGIVNQICGDAHVRNLGAFASPDGSLVFDINDFDETAVAPFEWDVKRMATSLILAGREGHHKDSVCEESAESFVRHYRLTLLGLAKMGVLDVARYQVHRLGEVQPVSEVLQLAQRATRLRSLEALTVPKGKSSEGKTRGRSEAIKGARVFRSDPPTLTGLEGRVAKQVLAGLDRYAESLQPERRHFLNQYKPVDVAFKVVGTGSVGLRDYCVYLQGNGSRDPLFLQVKEETQSAYAPYSKQTDRRSVEQQHQGQRVVNGERAMQLQSDPFLGWTSIEGRDYLVRQLNDHKASINVGELKPYGLMEYGAVCGELLARGHARSGDPLMLAGYLGSSERFDDAIVRYAKLYADQTEKDWRGLVHSLKA